MAALVLARAAVPLGFMPDPARLAGGVLDIVICSADGIETVTVDDAGTPVPRHPRADPGPVHDPVHDGLCPFAAAAALALAALAVVVFGVFRWPERLDYTISAADVASARVHGALGPRAPPSA